MDFTLGIIGCDYSQTISDQHTQQGEISFFSQPSFCAESLNWLKVEFAILIRYTFLKEHWEGCICLAAEFKYQQSFSRIRLHLLNKQSGVHWAELPFLLSTSIISNETLHTRKAKPSVTYFVALNHLFGQQDFAKWLHNMIPSSGSL